jgi:superfamily II DNA or RNA helicase
MDCEKEIPFLPGDWLIDKNNPGNPGQYSGRCRRAGPHIMVELEFPGRGKTYRPLTVLEPMSKTPKGSIEDRIKAGYFGGLRDLQRLITFEKLKGTLHEFIYSMEAAQIDFYPYQFKPVLKFINSPTDRMIIADEVGLGKTIESALIWIELQARRQAKRLLVVCPKILAEKWRDELRYKFLFDARVVDFQDLDREIKELVKKDPFHSFALISTYSGLRPPKAELKMLNEPPEEENAGSPKTRFLQELRHWSLSFDPFDLIIFDEAHYMRNPATTTFHLGEALAANAGAVLCVSATPVHNTNTDLHSLLRLVDENFFETQGMFEDLLEANRPAVQAANALAATPVDFDFLKIAVAGMKESRYISQSPLFKQFLEYLSELDSSNKTHLAKCQDLAEKLNLLGGYVNRTRRVQVKENRPLRETMVLPIHYTSEEMQLYQTILRIVRKKCKEDSRPFHVFQVMGLQLRAASCLPVLAKEIREGRFGDPGDLVGEALGNEISDEFFENGFDEDLKSEGNEGLLNYDFDKNDSKYKELCNLLKEIIPNEKAIIFAYYRPTLAYLRRRLMEDGINLTVIHGGIPNEKRWEELDRFKNPKGPRVLLSSEVGSEGIDLQFCRVMANYDLPWNPMRVEQRIGRIDRVGQQAKRLAIVNFKVKDTIEERLYERLHSKLMIFANSLGDLEDVIGKEVQQLTIQLLSQDLTTEQEQLLMEQSERVIEQRLLKIKELEESGDSLIAFSDYVQRKIEEDRELGRYVQPDELEDYLADFFEREFQGCELNHQSPADGCLRVRLNYEAQTSLSRFLGDDRSLSARPLRQTEFNITFKREVHQRLSAGQKRTVHFINHLSPLIRWITSLNRERVQAFYNVSALIVKNPEWSPGDYCYRIERWRLEGLSNREILSYGVHSLRDGLSFSTDRAETIIQLLLKNGENWSYVDCNIEDLLRTHKVLEKELGERFSTAVQEFQAENETAYQIKVQRVRNIFDRRIAEDEQRLKTLHEGSRSPRVIRMAEGRLRTAKENKEQRLKELGSKMQPDFEQSEVAAGVFRIIHP